MMPNDWTFWLDEPPPRDEIVECRRIGLDEEENLSFWVKPSLMAPEWNIGGVIWRQVRTETKSEKQAEHLGK